VEKMKIIDLYVNSQTGRFCASNGGVSGRESPVFYLGDTIMLRLRFITSTVAVSSFSVTDTFELYLDNNYYKTTTEVEGDKPMCYSPADYFNISGDWASADPLKGMISARVVCETESFAVKMGTNKEITAMLEIKVSGGGDTYTALQDSIICKNVVGNVGYFPAVGFTSGYTKVESDSRYQRVSYPKLPFAATVAVISNSISLGNVVHGVVAADSEITNFNGCFSGDVRALTIADGKTVVLKHGAGNLLLPGAVDLTMDPNIVYTFVLFDGKWRKMN
jgi:hypothetical protein